MAYGLTQSADLELSSSQYFSRTDTASLSITGASLTVSIWVKWETLPSVVGSFASVINKFSSGGSARGDWEMTVNTDNKLSFIVSDDGTYDATHYTHQIQDTASMTSTGTWYYMKGTFSSGTIVLYIDDSVVASTTLASGNTTVGDTDKPIGLGARIESGTPNRFVDGRLSLARVWSEVHSTADQCTVYGSTTNLAAEWTLDNTVNDNSGNSNTLTNNNAATFSADVPSVCAVTGPANLKSLDTNPKANIKSYNTNPLANIKSINTNA